MDEEAVAAEIARLWPPFYARAKDLRPLYHKLEEEIRKQYGGWDLGLPNASRYQYNAH